MPLSYEIPKPENGEPFDFLKWVLQKKRKPTPVLRSTLSQAGQVLTHGKKYNGEDHVPEYAEINETFPDSKDLKWIMVKNKWFVSGSSYYYAISELLYGNADTPNAAAWVKAQHLTFFEQVLQDENHPRHELYTKINEKRNGPNNFNLQDRLLIPFCPVDHEQIQQVTADLYGIYLVVYTISIPESKDGEVEALKGELTKVYIHGDSRNPTLVLRHTDSVSPGVVYNPMIPENQDDLFHFLEHPKDKGAQAEVPEGANHSSRTRLPSNPVPRELSPTPIDNLVVTNACLSAVLWLNVHDEDDDTESAKGQAATQTISYERKDGTCPITINLNPTVASEPDTPQQQDYNQLSLSELEKLASELYIYIPEATRTEADDHSRKAKFGAEIKQVIAIRGDKLPLKRNPKGQGKEEANSVNTTTETFNSTDSTGSVIFNTTIYINYGPNYGPSGPINAKAVAIDDHDGHTIVDYSKWSAAKIRQECKNRVPPIPVRSKMKAEDVLTTIVPLLVARDREDLKNRRVEVDNTDHISAETEDIGEETSRTATKTTGGNKRKASSSRSAGKTSKKAKTTNKPADELNHQDYNGKPSKKPKDIHVQFATEEAGAFDGASTVVSPTSLISPRTARGHGRTASRTSVSSRTSNTPRRSSSGRSASTTGSAPNGAGELELEDLPDYVSEEE